MKGAKWLRFLGIAAVLGAMLLCFRLWDLTRAEFSTATPLFSGKTVMVLIPHQDDELNLACGLLEQYVDAGSEVTLVYSTNGDYNGLAEQRSLEALAVAESVGIPRENVYYLGYGDQWDHQGTEKHLYFASDGDAVWTSHFGATATYGTPVIEPYRQSAYTRNNFLADLTALILEKRPDVIFCVDYDAHHDHMALDLFYEEAMGNILKSRDDYRPTVYKGFCYGTAWYAEADWLEPENLRSSKFPAWEHWDRLGIGYDWSDRVRLPVTAQDADRLLSRTTLYNSLRLFRSQNGHRFAQSVLNGDKVFWERRTDSLLYRAEFRTEGERVALWNDFKLMDATDFSALVNTGVGYGDRITVTLERPTELDAVWLYDAPSPDDNILSGYLTFDDGTRVDFGPLEPGGSATEVSFDRRTVTAFELCITETEGDTPGLTEIEAYCGAPERELTVLMAVDGEDNFVYDYWIPDGNAAEFTLYAYPAGSAEGWADVDIDLEGGPGCGWSIENGKLRVTCPVGQQATVTISSGEVSTSFRVANPFPLTRQLIQWLRQYDCDRAIEEAERSAQNP